MPLTAGTMTLETDKKSYRPGQTVKVTATLKLKKPIKAEWLKIILEGSETAIKTKRETVTIKGSRGKPAKKVERAESEEIVSALQYDEKMVGGRRVYQSGKFRASFKLPKTLKRTAKSGRAKVEYSLKARLNIPLGLDVNAEQELVVN
ncbi:TPA: hypothetical protein EYP38_01800 [Candidatus Micrarchaeota archaeon]|nr:hypothetical protein [Candidatus Micrarchaeota archaeon]